MPPKKKKVTVKKKIKKKKPKEKKKKKLTVLEKRQLIERLQKGKRRAKKRKWEQIRREQLERDPFGPHGFYYPHPKPHPRFMTDVELYSYVEAPILPHHAKRILYKPT